MAPWMQGAVGPSYPTQNKPGTLTQSIGTFHFFAQFDSANLLAGEVPMRYRHAVLEPGGSVSANDLVRNFLGRPQSMTAFQHWMEEEFATASPTATAGGNGR